jgi:hypothetical protein
VIEEMLRGQAGGRHALDEDAIQTPIFHALARGGLRQRQQAHVADSLEEFRRDPLTAPIPIQALAPVPAPDTLTILERLGAAVRGSARGPGSTSATREPSRRHRLSSTTAVRDSTEREPVGGAPREWAGLSALAERGRHHRTPVGAHW